MFEAEHLATVSNLKFIRLKTESEDVLRAKLRSNSDEKLWPTQSTLKPVKWGANFKNQ